jgi:A/G-specific adenine glycosylase
MKNNKKYIEQMDILSFRDDLIGWFENEQRELPWRKDRDPYKVWVSEIMLQQTRVDTVIPYFTAFIEKFPTIEKLATADEEMVLKAWEGLGYYSRVRNLQSAVKEVHEQYNGIVPASPGEILSLKGVGPYTAGAILSIAYGVPEPAVDGNVMRVLSRILLIWDDIAKPSSRRIFEEAVRKLISHDNPSSFNQALMELGALICTPTSPSCLLCPVREHCAAFAEGVQQELPVKTKKKKQRTVQLAAGIFTNESGRILIRKRPENGLLGNLWEFPGLEISPDFQRQRDQLAEHFSDYYGIIPKVEESLCQIDHVFSHLIWNVQVYSGSFTGEIVESPQLKLVDQQEIQQYAFPVPYQKMLKEYLNYKKADK